MPCDGIGWDRMGLDWMVIGLSDDGDDSEQVLHD